MNGFWIKLMGCSFMVLDHIGAALYPEVAVLRVLGRLAFPIFAWQLVTGYRQTRSVHRFMLRLLLFCCISQVPYLLVFKPSIFKFNIFFTLFVGLGSLAMYDKLQSKPLGLVMVLMAALVTEWIFCDYGAYGILTIFLFHIYYDTPAKLVVSQISLNLLRQAVVVPLALGGDFPLSDWWVWSQPVSLLALVILRLYNQRQGYTWKYFFYLFYPGHLLILYYIRLFNA